MGQEPQSSTTSGPDGQSVSAADVAAYLLAHPEFLTEHPEVVNGLTAPTADRPDGAVDLRSFMVERLRAELDRLSRSQRALISASRANQISRNRVHGTVLRLLDATTLEELIQTIATDLAVMLDIDVAVLLIESTGRILPCVLESGVRLVSEGTIKSLMDGQEIKLDGQVRGDEAIFGAAHGLVHSQALIRIDVSSATPPCMLALGSRHPDMFHAGMGTELVAFLASVLERCIRSWLVVET